MTKEVTVQIPEIPGQLYKGFTNRQEALFCALFGGLLGFLVIQGSLTPYNVLLSGLFFVLAVVNWKLVPRKPASVYLTSKVVEVDFGKGEIKHDNLDNYFLYIGTRTGRAISGYTYFVGLSPKQNAKFGNRTVSKRFATKTVIPLRYRILTPKNLKEYVEALQKQLEHPLEVLFQTEDVLQEYRFGKFKKDIELGVN